MGRFLVRRLFSSLTVMLLVTLVLFVLLRTGMGEPALLMMGEEADQTTAARLRQDLGLERPILVQYLDWLNHLLRGELGKSYRQRLPVTELILDRLPVTLELSFLALTLALVIALPVGILASLRHNSHLDVLIRAITVAGVAMPNFWLGVLFILFLSIKLRLLPTSGYVAFTRDPLQHLKLMVLPTLTLSIFYICNSIRIVRSSMLDVLGQRFMVTARAKGLSERRVIWVHGLRNALLPLVTVIGLNMAGLFGGAVVAETIFAVAGIGRLLVTAVLELDFPVVQGVVLLITMAVLASSLVVDMVYAVLDPRIRFH